MSTETANQTVPAGAWIADPVHSAIQFAVTHNGIATFRSGFKEFSATLTGGAQPKLEGAVDAASIDIGEPQQKGHLLSPEFFDVDRVPQLKFESTDFTVEQDGSVRFEGTLEIRGESRSVAGTGKYIHTDAALTGGERIGLSLTAVVDRRDFGMNFQAPLPNGGNAVEWDVTITAELELAGPES